MTRALMVVAGVLGPLAMGVAVMGMKCTRCGGDDPRRKAGMAAAGGGLFLLSGEQHPQELSPILGFPPPPALGTPHPHFGVPVPYWGPHMPVSGVSTCYWGHPVPHYPSSGWVGVSGGSQGAHPTPPGLAGLIACSWYGHRIVTNFYDPTVPVNFK